MSTGPTIKRGSSKQDYATPDEFMLAMVARFGPIEWDLAATAGNAKSKNFISPEQNSLTCNWAALAGLLFLNPPFGHIEPWAAKCAKESELGAKILLLTPASVGSVWFRNHVHRKAFVFGLSPRLCFDGVAPFPKDCILSLYWGGLSGFDTWQWKETR